MQTAYSTLFCWLALFATTAGLHRPLRVEGGWRQTAYEQAVTRSPSAVFMEADNSEPTRLALVDLIEESWQRVAKQLGGLHPQPENPSGDLPPQRAAKTILEQCEEELRSATGLLVLATARRAAEHSLASRATLQSMFNKADVNQDGQLTYMEWFDWLGSARDAAPLPPLSAAPPPTDPDALLSPEPATPIMSPGGAVPAPPDPMVAALSQVLSQAVCSLKIAARIPENQADPLALTAAFVAGGIMAGALDADVSRTLLSRLSPRTRELVAMALALEGASLSSTYTDGAAQFRRSGRTQDRRQGRRRAGSGRLPPGSRTWTLPISVGAGPRGGSIAALGAASGGASAAGRPSEQDVIQIVDLAAIRVTQAPDIDAPVGAQSAVPGRPGAAVGPAGGLGSAQLELQELNLAMDAAAAEEEVEEEEGSAEDGAEADVVSEKGGVQEARVVSAGNGGGAWDGGEEDLDTVLSRVSAVAREVSALRMGLRDLEDGQAAVMRQLLLRQAGGCRDVLVLAMTLRAARLQHVSTMPTVLRQQVAVETLQLWAPISFQLGISAQVPELEVHSYVLLFPRSFDSFVTWYTQLNPIARRLLANFRAVLEERLRRDDLMPLLASSVRLQSRLKNPVSAFKKLVKSSKQKQQLHDMLGIRVVVQERAIEEWDTDFEGDPSPNPNPRSNPYPNPNPVTDFAGDLLSAEAQPYVDVLSTDAAEDSADALVAAKESVVAGRAQQAEEAWGSGGGEGEGDGTWETQGGGEDAAYWSDVSYMDMGMSQEEAAVWRVYEILTTIPGWREDKRRFKDYVSEPKPSGYQSLHATLVHAETSMTMEVQVRSQRMHTMAETGPASHNRYKALLLPPSVIQHVNATD